MLPATEKSRSLAAEVAGKAQSLADNLSPPAGQVRSRPYQGVRVKDPVKELLRRKRSVEARGAVLEPQSDSPSQPPADFVSEGERVNQTADGGSDSAGWKAPAAGTAPQGAACIPWPSPGYDQQDSPAQAVGYQAASPVTADLYMQTLCPSYTMLTYAHTPLLTNFGAIPMAPVQTAVPQVELPDSGLTYLPWGQPVTTISTIGASAGCPFASTGSPLLPVPLPMSLATVIPQLGVQGVEPQILEVPLPSDPDQAGPSLDEEHETADESPSLLDKLLEEHKDHGGKEPYGGSLFVSGL